MRRFLLNTSASTEQQSSSLTNHYSDNQTFAWVYNRHWGSYADQACSILNQLILHDCPSDSRILDLCCGTGQLAQLLTLEGYQVVGIDISAEMLSFARNNAPDASFIRADARSFNQPPVYSYVVSTYDSLNFMMSLEDMVAVFTNVYVSLQPDGAFLFDLNTETGYQEHWEDGAFDIIEDDLVCLVRSSYLPEDQITQFDFTIFRYTGEWRRSDLTFYQRCYAASQVIRALTIAGFRDIEVFGYDDEHGLTGFSSQSERAYYLCQKPK